MTGFESFNPLTKWEEEATRMSPKGLKHGLE
jgi:hypothetical protein